MIAIAKDAGLAREQLVKSFSDDGNPSLKSTLAVMKSLEISLSVVPTKTLRIAA